MTDLHDKTALITGGTDGIGKETARLLAAEGANVLIVGRDERKGAAIVNELSQQTDAQFITADLGLMTNVQSLADTIQRDGGALDMLVHCAGATYSERTLTREGLEAVFAVQYFARYLLSYALAELLSASAVGKVVNVSAGGTIKMKLNWDNLQGEQFYHGAQVLRHESVANDMLVLDLIKQYPDVSFYGYGPGYVKTNLLRDMPGWFQAFSRFAGNFIGITAAQAAQDIVDLLTGNYASGLFSRHLQRQVSSSFIADAANRDKLRRITDDHLTRILESDAE